MRSRGVAVCLTFPPTDTLRRSFRNLLKRIFFLGRGFLEVGRGPFVPTTFPLLIPTLRAV